MYLWSRIKFSWVIINCSGHKFSNVMTAFITCLLSEFANFENLPRTSYCGSIKKIYTHIMLIANEKEEKSTDRIETTFFGMIRFNFIFHSICKISQLQKMCANCQVLQPIFICNFIVAPEWELDSPTSWFWTLTVIYCSPVCRKLKAIQVLRS